MKGSGWKYLMLVGVNLIYAFSSLLSKGASGYDFLSWQYLLFIAGAVLVLGIYAILWQQVLKRMDVSDAYMFKGLTVIFVLLLARAFFGETITLSNGIGAAVIVGGIALNAKS